MANDIVLTIDWALVIEEKGKKKGKKHWTFVYVCESVFGNWTRTKKRPSNVWWY